MPPSILFALPLIVAATFVPAYDTQAGLPADDLPRPTPVQLAWQRAELGVVYHYDLHVFDDGHYVQSKNRRTPPGDTNRFAPTELDVGLWVRTARAMGAAPRQRGSKDACIFIQPCRGESSTACGKIKPYATTTAASRSSATNASCSGSLFSDRGVRTSSPRASAH